MAAQAAKPDDFGFRTPLRASFQYYQINEAQLIASYKPQVTEKEIEDYYTKNKNLYQIQKLPELNKEKPTEEKKDEEKKDETKADSKEEAKKDDTKPAVTSTTETPCRA